MKPHICRTNRSISVLVVEDEVDIRMATVIRLRSRGYQVTAVSNGQECLESIAENQFDVVLMDIRMPVMGGLSAMAEMNRDPATNNIPVIVVSASLEDQTCALDSGAAYFIRKPFLSAAISEAIESVLRTTENQYAMA